MNPLLMNAFNDELEQISNDELQKKAFVAALGRAASHLGGGIGRAMVGAGKGAGKTGVRKGIGDLGAAALKNKKLTGQVAAVGTGAALLGTGAALS